MHRPSARHVLPEFTERTGAGQRTLDQAALPAAGTPGKRLALPGARVLVHQPSAPEPFEGRTSDPVVRAEELAHTRADLEEMLVRHTRQRPERVAADIERDLFLDASAVLEHGLIDRIVPSRLALSGAPGAR